MKQWNSESEYDLHHTAVGLARERNAFSEAVQKVLEGRYAAAVRRFAGCRTDHELRARWKDALAGGNITGPLWGLMSHPRASDAVLDLASQEVHMLSHQIGAASRADLRRLRELESESSRLRQQLQRQREKASENLAQRQRAIAAHEQRVAVITDLEVKLHAAQSRLNALSSGEVARAEQLLQAEAAKAQRAAALAESSSAELARTAERCTRLEHSAKRLRAMLAAADAVICVSGHVSHGAYYVVKRVCKEPGKPCVLLKSPGLSAFLGGIHALTRGDAAIPEFSGTALN